MSTEEQKAKWKAYYESHKEAHKISQKKYRVKCSEIVRERDRKYRLTHKEQIRETNRVYNAKMTVSNKKKLEDYKTLHPCIRCGEKNPIVLQFHHRDASKKDKAITEMIRSRSWEATMKEIDKCDVVCANCHLIIHDQMRRTLPS